MSAHATRMAQAAGVYVLGLNGESVPVKCATASAPPPYATGAIVPGAAVCREVIQERCRQESMWGEQNHPDGTGDGADQAIAGAAQAACDEAFEAGHGTWKHILREEYAEAMSESDPVRLREELIQVAAVAVAWVEAIDRRGS